MAWLHKHQEYSTIGRPRPGSRFIDVGTLHGDGAFEAAKPSRPGSLLMQAIKLRPDGMSIGVGVRMARPFPG
jgi:hypothetical protein